MWLTSHSLCDACMPAVCRVEETVEQLNSEGDARALLGQSVDYLSHVTALSASSEVSAVLNVKAYEIGAWCGLLLKAHPAAFDVVLTPPRSEPALTLYSTPVHYTLLSSSFSFASVAF
jgi:hypothetical protein